MAAAHQFYAGIVLVMLTIVMQSAGMAGLVLWARAHLTEGIRQFGLVRAAVLVVRFTSLIVCLHVSEILLWACFFRWNCFATWESAFYFSAGSYSTVGCGDLFLPRTWRAVGPVESLTGVLMCGVSASLLFAIVTRLIGRDEERELAKAFTHATSAGAQPLIRSTTPHAKASLPNMRSLLPSATMARVGHSIPCPACVGDE
jgi:voltage-gated potassium channel